MSDIFRDYSFGGWVRHIRIENNITLREAGRRLGEASAGNLSKLERSEMCPPKKASKVEDICKAIGKPEASDFLKSLAFQHHLAELRKEFLDE